MHRGLIVAAARAKRSRGPNQLPPGRHGLSRRFVARNHPHRLLAGVRESATASGSLRVPAQALGQLLRRVWERAVCDRLPSETELCHEF